MVEMNEVLLVTDYTSLTLRMNIRRYKVIHRGIRLSIVTSHVL